MTFLNPNITIDQRTTNDRLGTQLWAQIGWLDQSGKVYGPDHDPRIDSDSLIPLWILLED